MSTSCCRAPGCRRKPHARGLCQKHYDEQRKGQRPGSSRQARPGPRAERPAARTADGSAAGAGAAAAADPDKVCSVPGCVAPHHARGYCKSHYGQLRRKGGIMDQPAGPGPGRVLTREQRLVEIRKRHELFKKEIASIHQALASEPDED